MKFEEVGDVAARRLLHRDTLQLTLQLCPNRKLGTPYRSRTPTWLHAPVHGTRFFCYGVSQPLDNGLLSEEAGARDECLNTLLNVIQSDEGGEERVACQPPLLLLLRLR